MKYKKRAGYWLSCAVPAMFYIPHALGIAFSVSCEGKKVFLGAQGIFFGG
jgi:hypothetical protein